MNLTHYHTKYFAYELTKRCSSNSLEKLAGAFAGARVDLNPHQVEAALFAFESPLSKGALLADEVGLGKTIEAGLVIAQKWAERKRQILIITPSNLRKQWHQEMTEKFFVPCSILEAKTYNAALKQGCDRPFESEGKDTVVICSYQFARNKAYEIEHIAWDLVVIDEAHRLRNVYKTSNVIANTLRKTLQGRHKLLLTATPLQNSLLELFGLVSFIDEKVFGDLKSFREQFSNLSQPYASEMLKVRLKPICHRTLRRDVMAYVPFTQRHAILEEFTPSRDEQQLYELVSEYLSRDNLQALPASQRALTTLVMRKLLASSTFAIAGTLISLSKRLKAKLSQQENLRPLTDELDEDYEGLADIAEEWEEEEHGAPISELERAAIQSEVLELDAFAELAASIEHNAKGNALLKAFEQAFADTVKYGGAQKAIVFTESRRTQDYLLRLLRDSPWGGGLLLFNGTNNDDQSKAIYTGWLKQNEGTDQVTGSKTADMRSALVDYFRKQGTIMIATEAAAEGINLQFCSLIVNYDLPWNPQRIEQRIGRCHRYGQRHDVVVVNFLNQKNAADRRVFELLAQKFQLFEGVFGTSDEVLGAIESGVDFEKRIAEIYQRCRKPDEIEAAFNRLQQDLSFEINEAMTQTRQKLLENFDEDVCDKLKISDQRSKEVLGRFERLLMQLTEHELAQEAEFSENGAFRLNKVPEGLTAEVIPLGLYELPRRSDTAYTYRMGHPLADALIEQAKQRVLSPIVIQFDYAAYGSKVSVLETLLGQSGDLSLSVLTVEALDQTEDYLIFATMTDGGQILEEDTVQKLLCIPGRIGELEEEIALSRLDAITQQRLSAIQQQIAKRNADFFEAEAKKLDGWAEDLKVVLEREIKEFDRQIREAKRAATAALTLEAKLAGQKQLKELEKQRNQKRRSLFEAQDEVDRQRDELIAQIEGKLEQKSELQCLFTIRWSLS
ncbi:MAG: DEAD/DEAH box helicase family protein [Aphanocapsa sp. GSE-SYN-MK-11-07L]|jgi:adenine-specific DNA-methyltransferase|nr:DEAD/DEAH box helicase family protein [Aphanocapsa sp. GSE-SYN-MK-11-07L]